MTFDIEQKTAISEENEQEPCPSHTEQEGTSFDDLKNNLAQPDIEVITNKIPSLTARDRFERLPKELRGPSNNKYGGHRSRRMRGFRGGTYGPASDCFRRLPNGERELVKPIKIRRGKRRL